MNKDIYSYKITVFFSCFLNQSYLSFLIDFDSLADVEVIFRGANEFLKVVFSTNELSI